MPLIGIDLGTTNTVVSIWDKGKVETINIDGKTTFPSVVSIKNGNILTGYEAKSRLIIDPLNTVSSTKRDMGSNKIYSLENIQMNPSDVAQEILKAIKIKIERTIKTTIEDAVITVPAYFTSEQRQDTLKAAEASGFNVLRLIPEPTAAAINYGLDQSKNQIIMVYDLGGGTFDISIMRINGNKFEVIAVDGDSKLGGDDFDETISNLIIDKIKEECGRDLKKENERLYEVAKQKIKEAAEKAKIELSEAEYTEIIIPNVLNVYSLDFELSRQEYYRAIKPYLDKTIEKIHSVLKEANLTKDDIDKVLLVGGSTKTPIVREIVKKEIKDPYYASNVDEVVSNGAAIFAANLSTPSIYGIDEEMPNIVVKERTVHTYSTEFLDERTNKFYCLPIIKKGTTIPCRDGIIGFTVKPYQRTVYFGVYRGEGKYIEENEELGNLDLTISNPKSCDVCVGCIFEIDKNMIIKFTGLELQGDKYVKQLVLDSTRQGGKLDADRAYKLIEEGKVKYINITIEQDRGGI